MKKRTIALLLSLVLALGIITPAAAATSFTDVPADAWYAADVADVQKYGIIQGVGENRFLPKGVLTYAQAITMAARVYANLKGDTIPDSGDYRFWYEPYLEYALDKELIDHRFVPTNLNVPCSRADMAYMFYYAIWEENNAILNNIDRIPDLAPGIDTIEIYELYRFGILAGNDKYGTFYPGRSITRAETAAILNRVLDIDKRKIFSLEPGSPLNSLDLSCAWTNVQTYSEDVPGYGDYVEEYNTTIAFQPDGKLYGLYYIPFTGYIECFRGSYKINGEKVTMTVHWADIPSYTVTYRAEPLPFGSMPGFFLTLIDGDSVLFGGMYGDPITFVQDETMTAAQCKSTCLNCWGMEPQ